VARYGDDFHKVLCFNGDEENNVSMKLHAGKYRNGAKVPPTVPGFVNKIVQVKIEDSSALRDAKSMRLL
jgi:hypothetical protein